MLKDNPEKLIQTLNKLINENKPFIITTCRSGLAIDIFDADTKYSSEIIPGKRLAYTSLNGDCLSDAIEEALESLK